MKKQDREYIVLKIWDVIFGSVGFLSLMLGAVLWFNEVEYAWGLVIQGIFFIIASYTFSNKWRKLF